MIAFLPPISATTRFTCPCVGRRHRRALDDVQADVLRSGEGDDGDVRVLDEVRTDLLADAGQEREDVRRDAGLEEDLDEPVARCRVSARPA